MPAKRSSSESGSSPPRGKKRDRDEKDHKKEKKHKTEKKEKTKKAVKQEKEKKSKSEKKNKSESEGEAPAPLRLGPARPPPASESEVPRHLRQRSRSRDEPPMLSNSGMNPLDRMDAPNGGKGKGKGKGGKGEGEEPVEKEQPNFEASGLLAMQDNSKNGIALKFTLPPDSRMPDRKWRLYCFSKQNEAGKIIHIHRLASYLFGKDRRVADVPTDHPTCSKQHAVLHFRLHSGSGQTRPYIMDLESLNGTHLNGERIESARYYELKEGDSLKFGLSSRDFVLLHSASAHGLPIDPELLKLGD